MKAQRWTTFYKSQIIWKPKGVLRAQKQVFICPHLIWGTNIGFICEIKIVKILLSFQSIIWSSSAVFLSSNKTQSKIK